MKKHRILKIVLGMGLLVTVLPLNQIKAVDFDGHEDTYIKLCSSKLTSSNKTICKEFNKHLDKKYAELKEDLKETKKELNETNKTIEEVEDKLSSLSSEVNKIEKDITYITSSIKNLEASIQQKEDEMKERLYVMQSTYNSNIMINFIFGSEDFSTLFSRLSSLTDITSYEKEVLTELAFEKESLNNQRLSLNNAKKLVQQKLNKQKQLQDELVELKLKQQNQIKEDQIQANEISAAQKKIDAALEALISHAPSGSLNGAGYVPGDSEVGNSIAKKALTRLGCRYWWGAPGGGYGDGQGLDNPNAIYFDCSGLVAWAHRQTGVYIGRNTAAGYASSGMAVSRNQLQPGDVITFNYGSGVTHIGIYIGGGSFVHASGYGSGVRGQYPTQHVMVSQLDGYWSNYVYNYRRLY